MDFDGAVEKRHSVRAFKGKKASWRSAIDAIDSAIKAPFADGRCHLKFIVIEDEDTLNKIAQQCNQLWINEASFAIVVCSDDRNLESMHGEKGKSYGKQQAGAAIENILLKVTDLGLGACWIGSFADEIMKQILKIPSHIEIEAIIPVGYEKEKPPFEKERRKREMLENVLFWEEWSNQKRPNVTKEPKDSYGLR